MLLYWYFNRDDGLVDIFSAKLVVFYIVNLIPDMARGTDVCFGTRISTVDQQSICRLKCTLLWWHRYLSRSMTVYFNDNADTIAYWNHNLINDHVAYISCVSNPTLLNCNTRVCLLISISFSMQWSVFYYCIFVQTLALSITDSILYKSCC